MPPLVHGASPKSSTLALPFAVTMMVSGRRSPWMMPWACPSATPSAICTARSIAILVVAQAAVVGLQVIGRHALHRPIPWTEEIARLLLVWLMCAGGLAALRHGQHPRVTALVRLLSEARRRAVDRGLRLVLLAFFGCLIDPRIACGSLCRRRG